MIRRRSLAGRWLGPRALAAAVVAIAVLGGPVPGAAESDGAELELTAAELRQRGIESRRAYELVRSLTVEVGPRSAGSDGDRRAVAWAERTMKELGLSNVRREPVTVPHWERGEEEAAIVSPHPQPLVVAALGGSVGTPEEGIVAEVVRVESNDELEALDDAAVAGKIVFIDRAMERRRDGSGYGEVAKIRRDGPALAAAKGAVAAVIRSVGTGTHRFAHTGGTRFPDGARLIPAAALAIPDADILAAQLEAAADAPAAGVPAAGAPVTLRLRLTSRLLPDAESANVIGEIPGRERPEEIVLLGAHLDSWDLGTGAIDDGSGCAAVLEAARLVLELPRRPRRTIRVVLFANEEHGLSGAKAYAEAHADEVADHALAMESDLGAGRVWRFQARVAPDALPTMERIHQLLAPLGIEWGGEGAYGGADLIPLRPLLVPMADLSPDATYYFDYHHTLDDTVDKVDPEDLAQHATAFAVVAWAVADSDVVLGPAPEPEARPH